MIEQTESTGTARRQLLQRFEAWLDDVLADEPAPPGLDAQVLESQRQQVDEQSEASPADRHCDLFALWSSMISLKQEVKLQSRTFKQLQDSVSPLTDSLTDLTGVCEAQRHNTGAVEQLGERVRAAVEYQEQQQARQAQDLDRHVSVLLDLHDRFERGLATSRKQSQEAHVARKGWWQRVVGRETAVETQLGPVEALQEGYALTMDRLKEVLREHDITPIECTGATFDPHTMVAVHVVDSPNVPDDTVLEVYEGGFQRDGHVLRPAKVKVSGHAVKDEAPEEQTEFDA